MSVQVNANVGVITMTPPLLLAILVAIYLGAVLVDCWARRVRNNDPDPPAPPPPESSA